MADNFNPGYDAGMGYPSPGYGHTLAERLQRYVGQNVTINVGPNLTPAMGVLHNVGSNYVELHRIGPDNRQEAIFVPIPHITAVITPMGGSSHRP